MFPLIWLDRNGAISLRVSDGCHSTQNKPLFHFIYTSHITTKQCKHYSKKPCPYGNCTFHNFLHHWKMRRTSPASSFFPVSDGAPCWERCSFHMRMSSCFYTMTFKKNQGSYVQITHFCTPLFLHELCLGHGIKCTNITAAKKEWWQSVLVTEFIQGYIEVTGNPAWLLPVR